ncbi:VOC family protein [uncultured Ferrimonas sp.]|uniref:VOC family protein n=1 Tax=uncultured Ferrimonas sp. TaxID=432640 RepID=UPI00261264F9|nr:VOC family protein [uncultured Ferrimonas sp.]
MSSNIGDILWQDLTVNNADDVAEFYQQVVGWQKKPVSMGEYDDHGMMVGDTMKAGVCHAKGSNAGMPPQWLMYVAVADLDNSIATAQRLGGELIVPERAMGKDRMAVIADPAGAVLALYQVASSDNTNA